MPYRLAQVAGHGSQQEVPWPKGLFPFGGAKDYGIAVMAETLTGLRIGGVF